MMRIFYQSIHRIDCERCGTMFVLEQGGVCTRCRDILCNAHLHGSLFQRIRVNLFGADAVCVACRAGSTGRATL